MDILFNKILLLYLLIKLNTMNIVESNNKAEQIGNTWEQFKSTNDERLIQLEKKGNVDPLTEIKLDKINKSLDEQKQQINRIEVALSRPINGIEEFKSLENAEYKSAFDSYIKKGIETPLVNLEIKRDLTTSIDSSSSYGGYLLSPNIQKIIIDSIEEKCIMRKICSVQEISSSSLDVIDSTNMTPSWLNETGTVSDTDTTIFSKTTINTFDLVAQPKVSQKLLDDSAIDIEQWLANRLADDFIGAEENAFINGTGSTNNQPTGILSYVGDEDGIETITSSDTSKRFTESDILDLYYSLDDKYVNNACFLMPRSAIKLIRQLKDTTSGHYLWNPALLSGQTDTLLGSPIYQSSYMPTIGKSSKSIIFGDFKYYQIVDRVGIRILRDPYTVKPYVRFYTTKRVGGDVINKDAFKCLISANY